MFNVIVKSAVVLLFVTVGIGLWDADTGPACISCRRRPHLRNRRDSKQLGWLSST